MDDVLRRWLAGAAFVISALFMCGCSNSTDRPTSAGTGAAATTAPSSSSAPTTTPVTSNIIVTVAGPVTARSTTGDLTLRDGGTDYTVRMSSSPKVVDVNGADVGGDAIEVGESVQVIGTIAGKTILATTIVVPFDPSRSTTTSSG